MGAMTIELETCNCGSTSQGALERVKYFQRQLLTVDDMVTDQDYFREKLRRHNRYLHGWGIVCGLGVEPAPTAEAPWRVAITPGYALGPFGDEIYVGEIVYLDLARCAAGDHTDPCDPGAYTSSAAAAGKQIYVAIRYAECFAKPVRSMPGGCGCEDTPCEYSRIRDSFEAGCLAQLRPSTQPPYICDLIHKPVPCPPKPSDPWVVLAQVNLPASTSSRLGSPMIDFTPRRQIYSTELLQAQLIHCCCKPKQVVPAIVTTVNPAAGAILTGGPSTVTATFSKSVQAATVNTSSFTVQAASDKQPLAGAVTYDDATRTATFTPKNQLRPDKYTVTVRGNGSSPVTDVDNLALDGDKDTKPGGDNVTQFIVQEVPK